MTNFEYYKDKILETLSSCGRFGVKNGKIESCLIRCRDCAFHATDKNCEHKKYEWLYEEHIEQPKLTKKERLFCELVETGWIARDCFGSLYFYEKEPTKRTNAWEYSKNTFWMELFPQICIDFKFIKWQDPEPWAVEDLLKLEVEE